jgi:hypothetical protein
LVPRASHRKQAAWPSCDEPALYPYTAHPGVRPANACPAVPNPAAAHSLPTPPRRKYQTNPISRAGPTKQATSPSPNEPALRHSHSATRPSGLRPAPHRFPVPRRHKPSHKRTPAEACYRFYPPPRQRFTLEKDWQGPCPLILEIPWTYSAKVRKRKRSSV